MTQSAPTASTTVLERLATARLELQTATNPCMQAAWQIEVDYLTGRMLREEGCLATTFDEIYLDSDLRYSPPD